MIFANLIAKQTNVKIIKNILTKISIEEVFDYILEFGSPFRKIYGTSKQTFNSALDKLEGYFQKMKEDGNEYFKKPLVKDPKMRNCILKTLTVQKDFIGFYSKSING